MSEHASARDLTGGRGKPGAFAVYILFILAPFTGGLTALAGWIVTVAAKGDAEGAPLDHLHRQGRMFWTALMVAIPIAVLGFIGWLTRIVLIGYPIGWAAWLAGFLLSAWLVINSILGLLRLQANRSTKD